MTKINDNHQDLEPKDFFKFEGRINRAKYIDIWGWNLTIQVTFVLLYFLSSVLFIKENSSFHKIFTLLSNVIFGLLALSGVISLTFNGIRRAHDCNKSGWFSIIPLYNIYLIWFKKGTTGENKYGNNPLDKKLLIKQIDEAIFTRQQKTLRLISFIMILGGFSALIILSIISYL